MTFIAMSLDPITAHLIDLESRRSHLQGQVADLEKQMNEVNESIRLLKVMQSQGIPAPLKLAQSKDSSEAPKKAQFILLFGVDEELFMTCFGERSEWKCNLESLPEDCSRALLQSSLRNPGLGCVVVEDLGGPHWRDIINYYKNGGFVVYFGIIGEYAAPEKLSREFDLQWRFSAYTRYEYELTSVGKQILGDAITEQEYSKSNLLSVPAEDRILVPKHTYATIEEFIENEFDSEDEDVDDYMAKAQARYAEIRECLDNEVPLALHTASHGGKIAYLGFVNGAGNIPQIVRALCMGVKTSNEYD
jgi:hypothetical protein